MYNVTHCLAPEGTAVATPACILALSTAAELDVSLTLRLISSDDRLHLDISTGRALAIS